MVQTRPADHAWNAIDSYVYGFTLQKLNFPFAPAGLAQRRPGRLPGPRRRDMIAPMPTPVLVTKLFIPPARPEVIARPRLLERLDEGLARKLTLVSAPAGFGKSTLVASWAARCGRPAAWLSLDAGDNDPIRFLTYLIAAVRTVAPSMGEGALTALQAPRPASPASVLPSLVNELTTLPHGIVLVLDDYHVIDARPVDEALAFLLEHLPPQVHLLVASREDPPWPLARLRTRGQLGELRAADLRFTAAEAAEFLNALTGFTLAASDVAALEERTEGWIAGLQLAAISMRGHADVGAFIRSFTGSHRFVMDYLVEEVLGQQPASVQAFLLRSSILEALCGSLCDAVLGDPPGSGQASLAYLERANLFLVPLDDERRWYRYHHLFAELLRQRLRQGAAPPSGVDAVPVTELHGRASAWYEANGMEVEAFRHAAAADDFARAEALIEGNGLPLQLRGAAAPVLGWLESLPAAAMDARPSLWVTYAATLMYGGRHNAVERRLVSAEAALRGQAPSADTRDLSGRIALLRATLAVMQNDPAVMIDQSRRALACLRPDNLVHRSAAAWSLGCAHQFQGDRAAAREVYHEVIAAGRATGNSLYTIAATVNLGQVQEADNAFSQAVATYRRVLELVGEPAQAIGCQAHLGLARIAYEKNELAIAEHHGRRYAELTQRMESIDSFASYAVFRARLHLAQGDERAAAAILEEAEGFVHQHGFAFRMPDIAAAQVVTLLRGGAPAAAEQRARAHGLLLAQARVSLAQGDASGALALLEPLRRYADARAWHDARLAMMVLQALALEAQGATAAAIAVLGEALALAEPGGLVRTFLDEGPPMARLLSAAAAREGLPAYGRKVLAALEPEGAARPSSPASPRIGADDLSERELEVLRLVARGLSNHDICQRLFLALSTVKGHNMKIFEKLRVRRRTEAVARARELGLVE